MRCTAVLRASAFSRTAYRQAQRFKKLAHPLLCLLVSYTTLARDSARRARRHSRLLAHVSRFSRVHPTYAHATRPRKTRNRAAIAQKYFKSKIRRLFTVLPCAVVAVLYTFHLHTASRAGHTECVRLLLSAGAGSDIDRLNPQKRTALQCAIGNYEVPYPRHTYPLLLAAGATIPSNTTDGYLRKIRAAGGFPAYEKAHRQALATKFAAKALPRLPTDVAAQVVAFAFHVGYY